MDYPHKEPVLWSFNVFFVVSLNEWLNKRSGDRLLEAPWRKLYVTVKNDGIRNCSCCSCTCPDLETFKAISCWKVFWSGLYRVSSRGNPRDQDKIHVLQSSPVTVMDVWFSLETYAMKTRYCSYDEFWTFVVLCFRCNFDNFRCIQWWKFRQNDDISVSFYYNLSTCAKNKTLKGYNENCFIISMCLLNAVVAVINIKKISKLHTYETLSNQYIIDYRLFIFCFWYEKKRRKLR